jgi:hypothetical protein
MEKSRYFNIWEKIKETLYLSFIAPWKVNCLNKEELCEFMQKQTKVTKFLQTIQRIIIEGIVIGLVITTVISFILAILTLLSAVIAPFIKGYAMSDVAINLGYFLIIGVYSGFFLSILISIYAKYIKRKYNMTPDNFYQICKRNKKICKELLKEENNIIDSEIIEDTYYPQKNF